MIKILSDSTCDLSPDLIRDYEITIIPLHIVLDEEEYEDGINISPDKIYEWSDAHQKTPKTSAPSLDRVIGIMRPLLDGGHDLVCFSISGSMSSSCNVMQMAAAELGMEDRVRVIDSRNLSTGIGLLVIEAALMARDHYSADEIAVRIREMIPQVRSSFVVDTMTYLRRGGRCSAVAALAGSALKIHPEIIVEGGSMKVGKKYRGSLDKVIVRYVRDLEGDLMQGKKDRVFITHSGCRQETIRKVRDYLSSLDHFQEILETRAGGVISSHCGPGTLGVLFIHEG